MQKSFLRLWVSKAWILSSGHRSVNIYRSLNEVWRSSQYTIKTKLKLYQSCVLSTLLYGSECWRITEHVLAKLSSFHTTRLRKLQRIFWPKTISNHGHLARCQQEDTETIITMKRRRWFGHVLQKDADSITKVSIHWTQEGKRKRGRPKTTRRRTLETEMKNMNHSWGTIQRLDCEKQGWKSFVAALWSGSKRVVNFPWLCLQRSRQNYFRKVGVSLRETNRQKKFFLRKTLCPRLIM